MAATHPSRQSLIRVAQTRPVVKICGNLYSEDSLMVAALEPDLMGWIFSPHSKRRITVESARRQIASIRRMKPWIFHAAVFAGNTVPEIRSVAVSIPQLDFVQIADGPAMVSRLRGLLCRSLEVIPVVRVSEKIADPLLGAYMPADWCILDTAVPGTYGGTGQTMDLSWVSHVKQRHMLAGGLNPENAADRLKGSSASGADVSSGVESDPGRPGRKDREKVRRFIESVKGVRFTK